MYNTLLNFSLEIFVSVSLLVSVLTASKSNRLTWLISIANQIASGVLFYNNNLTYNLILQFIFIGLYIFGYNNWNVKVGTSNIFLIISILLTLIFFKDINVDTITKLDLLITILSILGTVSLIYKEYQSWAVWTIINILSITLFTLISHYILAFTYIILLVISFKTYLNWKRNYEKGINIR